MSMKPPSLDKNKKYQIRFPRDEDGIVAMCRAVDDLSDHNIRYRHPLTGFGSLAQFVHHCLEKYAEDSARLYLLLQYESEKWIVDFHWGPGAITGYERHEPEFLYGEYSDMEQECEGLRKKREEDPYDGTIIAIKGNNYRLVKIVSL